MSDEHHLRVIARNYLGQVRAALDSVSLQAVEAIVHRLYTAYREGKKILIIGNGGSAATASHMACDLAKNVFGQFPGNSPPAGRFKVLALTENVPLITAWANDAGYEWVFREQVRTLIDPGDVLVAISGSGASRNVMEAVKVAKSMGVETIGILGFAGGELRELVDKAVIVTSDEYGPIEDVHMVLNHIFTVCLREMIRADSSRNSSK